MKTYYVIAFILCTLLTAGCKKEEVELTPKQAERDITNSLSSLPSLQDPPLQLKEVDVIKGEVDEDVWNYFQNIKTVLYATTLQTDTNTLDFTPNVHVGGVNKIAEKLLTLDINDSIGNSMPLSSMTPEQQVVFIDLYLAVEAKALNEKLTLAPELKEVIENENKIIETTIQNNDLIPLTLGLIAPEQLQKIKHISYADFERRHESDRACFKMVRKDDAEGFAPVGGAPTYPRDPFPEYVRYMWAQYSHPGHFVLRLPKHAMPWVYAAIDGKGGTVGHAGIIDKDISSTTDLNANSTIESYPKTGVQYHSKWDKPHYIMGIQRVKYYFSWKLSDFGIKRKCTPVDPYSLRYWANKYIGVEYTNAFIFPVAKLAAPHYFICTTLVWWCSHKAYGIDLSRWLSTIVTPSDLLIDENSYIIATVY